MKGPESYFVFPDDEEEVITPEAAEVDADTAEVDADTAEVEAKREAYAKAGEKVLTAVETMESITSAIESAKKTICKKMFTGIAVVAAFTVATSVAVGYQTGKKAAQREMAKMEAETDVDVDADIEEELVDYSIASSTTSTSAENNVETVTQPDNAERIWTSGRWAGESSNGTKYDYEAAGFIDNDEDGYSLSTYEWHDDKGNNYYDYGYSVDSNCTQTEWGNMFEFQVNNNPSILGRVVSEVLSDDEIASVINDYNSKDDNRGNDISIDFKKDVGGQLDAALRSAAKGDAKELQSRLKEAINDEGVEEFEHVHYENFDASTSVLQTKGKEATFDDVREKMVDHHYDVFDGVKVTFENGQTVLFGRCGAAQVVVEKQVKTSTAVKSNKVTEKTTKLTKTGQEGNGSEVSEGVEGGGSETSEGSEGGGSEGAEGNIAKDPNAIHENMGVGDESDNKLEKSGPGEQTDAPTFGETPPSSGNSDDQKNADEKEKEQGKTPDKSDEEAADDWRSFLNNNK